MRRLMRKAGNTDCFTLTEAETLIRDAVAKAALNALKPVAGDYRKVFLKQLAKAIALRKGTDEAANTKSSPIKNCREKQG